MLTLLHEVVDGKDLSARDAQRALHEILAGNVSDALLSAFITSLRMKGETVEEIAGFARQMRVHSVRIHTRHPVVLDTCGTGGDGLKTFNISTIAALVVAGCGVPVAKHGNRSVSSRCGSADLFERLGVRIDVPVLVSQRCLEKIGIAFLFAPLFHPSMKKVAHVRKELGMRSVFNLLGPLSNPAGANCQLLGVSQEGLAEKIVHVLKNLGRRHAFVVCGMDGMDEVTLTDDTLLFRLENGRITKSRFRPESAGMKRVTPKALTGGNADENAAIARKILAGKRGPKRDAVVLNAAFGLLAAGRAKNIKDGVLLAEDSLDSGRAGMKLHQLVQATQNH